MRRIRVGCLAAVLALGAAACSSVDAALTAPPAPSPAPLAAMDIVTRLEAPPDGRVPALHGLAVGDAVSVAGAAGARLRVVVMGEGLAVSAQYPPPGDPLADDGLVTVWRGQPPAPPVVAATAVKGGPSSSSDRGPAHPPSPAGTEGSSSSDREPTHPPRSSAEEPSSASSEPVPPRTSPRRMPAAEVGLVLHGLASWYGEEFAGRTTACGSVFDPGALTMASRELRCGTVVRVAGPSGAGVEAVVTDWGPAEWTGRRFDLSAATFAAIHHPGAGVVSVTVEVLAS